MVAVWEELEPEPVLFPSSSSLTNLLAAVGGSGSESTALGYEQLPPQVVPVEEGRPLGGGRRKSPKLLGMTKVVTTASELGSMGAHIFGRGGDGHLHMAWGASASRLVDHYETTD